MSQELGDHDSQVQGRCLGLSFPPRIASFLGCHVVSLQVASTSRSLTGLEDQLRAEISSILQRDWDLRDGNMVPDNDTVSLSNGAVKIEGTVLYADLSQSSQLAVDFQWRAAAKIIRAFLYSMSRLISQHNGTIKSFDGDRIMAVFLGGYKNTNAAKCALKMNHVVSQVIEPMVKDYFTNIRSAGFDISHCTGVDTSTILAVRGGQRGANDLVWVGRAPNLAAKLSEIRTPPYRSYISDTVFSSLNDEAKFSSEDQKRPMWAPSSFSFAGENVQVYRSEWTWKL